MLEERKIESKFVSLLAKLNLKRLFQAVLALACLGTAVLVSVDQFIGYHVRHAVYTDLKQLPARPYGLLLGTSKYFAKNTLNLFYVNRLETAKTLYETDKIQYLLLSGDNRTIQYNEPRTMLKDLRKMGIPDTALFMDFAGFRTLDSVIRAKEVFHAEPMIIISQRFHCERALFIAQYHDIDAICFAAPYPKDYPLVRVREMFARMQMLWDLISEKEPYFLGDPEPLPKVDSVPEESVQTETTY
ncbi:ElyC/SanA/YdcF family protein [Pasteurellaceae bacterium LIM206]|nr:ElyC/SanA/YdcF family protein [Pasteurellaceae bacterium LIM206]